MATLTPSNILRVPEHQLRNAPQVDDDEASERLQRLQALITRDQRAIQDAMVGREVSVLFEKPGRFEGQMVGKVRISCMLYTFLTPIPG